jgi:hypothetical protein
MKRRSRRDHLFAFWGPSEDKYNRHSGPNDELRDDLSSVMAVNPCSSEAALEIQLLPIGGDVKETELELEISVQIQAGSLTSSSSSLSSPSSPIGCDERSAVASQDSSVECRESLVEVKETEFKPNTQSDTVIKFAPPFGEHTGENSLSIDPAPMRFSHHCPFDKLQFMFSMCQLDCAFVTNGGRLVGVLLRDDIARS